LAYALDACGDHAAAVALLDDALRIYTDLAVPEAVTLRRTRQRALRA